MVKTISTEVAVIILIGAFLTVTGIYLNFQNLEDVNLRNRDYNVLRNNETIATLLQVIGISVVAVGVSRGMFKRVERMNNRFLNLMEAFTALVQREMEIIEWRKKAVSDKESREELEIIESETRDIKDKIHSIPKM